MTDIPEAAIEDYWAIREIVNRGRSWARVSDLAAENDARRLREDIAAEVLALVDERMADHEKRGRADQCRCLACELAGTIRDALSTAKEATKHE